MQSFGELNSVTCIDCHQTVEPREAMGWVHCAGVYRCRACSTRFDEREKEQERTMGHGDTFTKELPCDLTEEEIAARKDKLVETDKAIAQVMGEKALANQGFNADLKIHRAAQRAILDAIETKTEAREVECLERHDERRQCVEVIRADTGAIVSERPFTAEERQADLFEDEEANGAPKKKRGRKGKGLEVLPPVE